MPVKIFELAKELDLGALDLVEKLKAEGFNVRNHMNSLTDEEVEKAKALLAPVEEPKKTKKKTTVRKKAKKKVAKKKASASKKVVTTKEAAKKGDGEEAPKDKKKKVAKQKKTLIRRKAPTKKEAKVSRDKMDVLIQIHGFRFPPGKAQINAVNFGLLNKVISAIEQYPNSQVIISGHTDSKGDADKNLALSVKRAANVQKFLHEIGGISTERTESQGFGETKPVASNNKKRGRALNRRIEVLIINR